MIFAIGDIHGCDEKLARALEYLKGRARPDETVVFLGDYIDRGKDSRRVIEMLIEWKHGHPKTVFLRGNHEQLILDARREVEESGGSPLDSDEFLLWWQNGGRETVRSYGGTLRNWAAAIPATHWAFIEPTEAEHLEGGYHFVHAGLLPEGTVWPWAYTGRDPRLWIREEFHDSDAEFGGRTVVFGHTPQLSGKPMIGRNKIGLDTAAVFGGKLTVAAFDPTEGGKDWLTFEMEQF